MDKTTLETTDKLALQYYNRYNNEQIMHKHRERFIKFIEGIRILDIGCGTGRDCREFSNKGFDVTGIDASNEMLSYARREAPKVNFHNKNMEDILFDTRYNGVWICSSLYHINKEAAYNVLKSCYDGLFRGGLLFITIKEGIGQAFTGRKYFGKLKKFYAFYKSSEIITLVERAGFDVFLLEKEYKDQTWINVYARKK